MRAAHRVPRLATAGRNVEARSTTRAPGGRRRGAALPPNEEPLSAAHRRNAVTTMTMTAKHLRAGRAGRPRDGGRWSAATTIGARPYGAAPRAGDGARHRAVLPRRRQPTNERHRTAAHRHGRDPRRSRARCGCRHQPARRACPTPTTSTAWPHPNAPWAWTHPNEPPAWTRPNEAPAWTHPNAPWASTRPRRHPCRGCGIPRHGWPWWPLSFGGPARARTSRRAAP